MSPTAWNARSFFARWVARVAPGLCWFWIVCCGLPLAVGQTLHTVDAVYAEAKLLTLEAPSAAKFAMEGREQSLPTERIVRWGSWPGIGKTQAAWLSDGSWLCGAIHLNAPTGIVVESDWLACPPIPMQAVRGLVLAAPTSLAEWVDLQAQMLAAQGERDMVWLEEGRKLSGVIRWPASTTSNETEVFELDAGSQVVELSLAEVRAIVFSPALMGPYSPRYEGTQVGLRDGSLLRVPGFEFAAERVALRLDSGLVLASHDNRQVFAEGVACLASNAPAAVMLSQLEPASYRQLTDSTLSWDLGINRNVLGGPLSVDEGLCFEGLATHSSSQVAYRWDGSAARFLSEARFARPDRQANPLVGSVSCEILLARAGMLEKVHAFSLFRDARSQDREAELIDLDITGAKLVVLVIEKADFGQYGDHLIWLDARIAPASR